VRRVEEAPQGPFERGRLVAVRTVAAVRDGSTQRARRPGATAHRRESRELFLERQSMEQHEGGATVGLGELGPVQPHSVDGSKAMACWHAADR
jgi:hypothetical protein